MRARDSAQPRVNPPMPPPAIMITGPLCPKSMAAQPTWYFIQVESTRYCPTMTELLEANERSQTEQGRPDSKKQNKQMQIGVDSFSAMTIPMRSPALSPTWRVPKPATSPSRACSPMEASRLEIDGKPKHTKT